MWSIHKHFHGKNGESLKVCCYITGFKSDDYLFSVKTKIRILPMLSFDYNSYSFGIEFGWLTFNAWLEYIDTVKSKKYN